MQHHRCNCKSSQEEFFEVFKHLAYKATQTEKQIFFFFSNNEETFWEKIEVFLCLVGQEIGNKSFFVSIVFFVTPLVMPQCTQRFPVVSNNDCSGGSCSRGEGKIKSLSLRKMVRIFYYFSQTSLLNLSAFVHCLTTPEWDVGCPKKILLVDVFRHLADIRCLTSSGEEKVTVIVEFFNFCWPLSLTSY